MSISCGKVSGKRGCISMAYDIAPDLRRTFKLLPLEILVEMKKNLCEQPVHDKIIDKVVFDISVEILRKKWGG